MVSFAGFFVTKLFINFGFFYVIPPLSLSVWLIFHLWIPDSVWNLYFYWYEKMDLMRTKTESRCTQTNMLNTIDSFCPLFVSFVRYLWIFLILMQHSIGLHINCALFCAICSRWKLRKDLKIGIRVFSGKTNVNNIRAPFDILCIKTFFIIQFLAASLPHPSTELETYILHTQNMYVLHHRQLGLQLISIWTNFTATFSIRSVRGPFCQ